MGLKYRVGQLLDRLGYRIVRKDRYPQSTINLVAVGFTLLRSRLEGTLTIIQIGAFDGRHNDPLQRILRHEQGYRAVLVEPQGEPFAELAALYQDRPDVIVEQVAITAEDGPVTLYFHAATSSSPKASLDPTHATRFGQKAHNSRAIQVDGVTFSTLLKRHRIQAVDLLQIDAEGRDLQILKDVFAAGVRPAVVNLESHHLSGEEREQLRRVFATEGYDFIENNLDTFAIRQDVIHGQA